MWIEMRMRNSDATSDTQPMDGTMVGRSCNRIATAPRNSSSLEERSDRETISAGYIFKQQRIVVTIVRPVTQ